MSTDRMMMTFPQRVQQTKFNEWLNANIYVDAGYQTEQRKYVILDIIRNLRSYIGSRGYIFREDLKKMSLDWARFVFHFQQKPFYKKHFKPNPTALEEDYIQFYDTFNNIEIEWFQKQVKYIQDLQTDGFHGSKLLNMLFPFAWYYIDINNSSATQLVDEMSYSSDSDDQDTKGNKKKVQDQYHIDQNEASKKFNRWD